MKKTMPLFILLCALWSVASEPFNVYTSINDVYIHGENQRIGSMTFEFNGDVLDNYTISESNPVYIRINWEGYSILAQTIVDPTGKHSASHGNAISDAPIDLKLTHRGFEAVPPDWPEDQPISIAQMAGDLPESAVQLVRAIEGEGEIWVRISQPINRYLDTDFDGIGDSAPHWENPVSFTINFEGIYTDNRISESGFDFSTSANVDTYANWGQDTPAVDTIMFMDYNKHGCNTYEAGQLQAIDIMGLEFNVPMNSAARPEGAPHGGVNDLCRPVGVTLGSASVLPINYVGDYIIARGKDENLIASVLKAPVQVALGESFDIVNQVFGDASSHTVVWDFGSDVRTTTENTTTYAYKTAGEHIITATTTTTTGLTTTSQLSIMVTDRSEIDEVQQLRAQSTGRGEVMLTWEVGGDSDAHLDHFLIYQRRQGQGDYEVIGNTYDTHYNAKALQDGAYDFRIVPVYLGGAVGKSVEMSTEISESDQFRAVFPHVAKDPSWFTGAAILNPHQETLPMRLVAYADNGNELATAALNELPSNGKILGLMTQFFSADTLASTTWVAIEAEKPLVAFELFGQSGRNMTGVPVSNQNYFSGRLNIGHRDVEQYAAASLLNVGSETATVQLTGYDSLGQAVATSSHQVEAGKKLLGTSSQLFETWNDDIRSIAVDSNAPLAGFGLWGDLDPGQVTSGSPLTGNGSLYNVLPLVEPGSKIIINNADDVENQIAYAAYTYDGRQVTTRFMSIPAGGSITNLSDILIGNSFYGHLVIRSTRPVTAMVDLLRQEDSGAQLAEAIPSSSSFGSELVFAHIADMATWGSQVIVVNSSNQDIQLHVIAYDANGTPLSSKFFDVAGHGRLSEDAFDMFPHTQGVASLKISTSEKVLTGHLLFYTRNGHGGIMGGTTVRPY